MSMTSEQWHTVEQIAELLSVHPDTVRSWLRAGRIKGRNFGGRTGYRVRDRDLQAFLDEEDDEQGKPLAA